MEQSEAPWGRDLPFFAAAALIHMIVLAVNPRVQWGGAAAPAPEKTIAVDFVAAPPSSALAPVPAGDGKSDAIPAHGEGTYVPEKIKKTLPAKKKTISPAARAARSKMIAERRRRQTALRAARAERAALEK